MKKIFLTLALALGIMASAQVRIGGTGTTVDANAILELQSTTKGLLFPNVALTSTTAFAPLSAHTAGMTVYNTATAGDVTPGMYTNSGTAWVKLGGSSSTAYQNIVGSVEAFTTSGIISVGTYIATMNNGGSTTLTLPTSTQIGQTIWVKNQGTGATTVNSSFVINGTRSRAFVWDGSVWNCMIP